MSTLRPARLAAALLLALSGLASTAAAAGTARTTEAAPDADARAADAARLDRLSVVGSAEQAAELAGSASFLDAEALGTFGFTDIHRVLRQVTGVYLVDEEGYGVRPNIGIRGSGTDRNSRITVMEDGLLIAPAPYAAPAAYYFPATARMSAMEIRKGSSTVKAGPRTTGGAVNLVSTPIPRADLAGLADLAIGRDATLLGHGWMGGGSDTAGWLLETVQQQTDGFKDLDGGGDTGYRLHDYLFKGRLNSAPDAALYQELELKAVKGSNDGNETYLGLTLDDFRATPYRRYAGSQVDRIETAHEQLSLRHRIEFSERIDLTTALYRHTFSRAWYKLQDVTGTGLSTILANPAAQAERLAWLRGATSPVDALRVRNNNRGYESEGLQTVLAWRAGSGDVEHAFEAGLRWHRDEEDRFQQDDRYQMLDGRMVLTSAGLPGSQENRVVRARALSFYLQDEIRVDDWVLTPGLRYERIDLERFDYALGPDGRDAGPTRRIASQVSQLLPGLGVTRLLSDGATAFVSVHKGFNPPAPGATAQAEESVNVEAGLRWAWDRASAELVGFHNRYSNLVGTCTASTGGNCNLGDQFDGGAARVEGVEASARWALAVGDTAVPLQLGYTWTRAEFRSSFVSSFEEWGTVNAGDALPYLPEHALSARVGVERARWDAHLGATWLDAMRTRAGRGTPPPTQRTDSAWVFDLAARYTLNDRAELYARIENLTGRDTLVSWRPAGARPGRERSALLGLRVRF